MNDLRSSVLCDQKAFAEHYLNIFERFLDKNWRRFNDQEMYWTLLAKFVERCSNEQAKQLQSRLQTRIVEASKGVHFSLGLMHFIRSTLCKCPTVITHNRNLFVDMAHRSLNFTCCQWVKVHGNENRSRDSELEVTTRLAVDIYFRVMRTEQEARILLTIQTLLRKSPPYDLTEMLPLDVLKNPPRDSNQIIAACIWVIYGALIGMADAGVEISLDDFVNAFEASYLSENQILMETSVNALEQVCSVIGFSFCQVSKRVLAILTNNDHFAESQWKALRILSDSACVGSMVHNHFEDLAQKLVAKCVPKENEVKLPKELVALVISVMKTSLPLLQPRTLESLQMAVCKVALLWDPPIEAIELLNALLELNHDEVPLPLQVAQTVYSRDFSTMSADFRNKIERGRTICSILSHPKMPPMSVKLLNDADEIMETQNEITTPQINHINEVATAPEVVTVVQDVSPEVLEDDEDSIQILSDVENENNGARKVARPGIENKLVSNDEKKTKFEGDLTFEEGMSLFHPE
ncbi:hypothetical protein Ddc_12591 [Ditylenchus destructor]|nr:hypothetical protein Ddc_12591 [Ditylenchus destructor]